MEELKPHQDKPRDPNLAIEITDATFAWDKEKSIISEDKKGAESKEKGEGSTDKEAEPSGKDGEDSPSKKRMRVDQEDEASVTLLPLENDEDIVKTLFDVNLNVEKVRLYDYKTVEDYFIQI